MALYILEKHKNTILMVLLPTIVSMQEPSKIEFVLNCRLKTKIIKISFLRSIYSTTYTRVVQMLSL